jgi:peptidoglycan/LPS O-acetylase OafA/YrhL
MFWRPRCRTFFLVSGFLIAFSITRLSRSEFLFSRAVRIYAVYVTSILLLVLVSVFLAPMVGESLRRLSTSNIAACSKMLQIQLNVSSSAFEVVS